MEQERKSLMSFFQRFVIHGYKVGSTSEKRVDRVKWGKRDRTVKRKRYRIGTEKKNTGTKEGNGEM